MHFIAVLHRQQLIDLILSNLATAGIIQQDEMEGAREELNITPTDELGPILFQSLHMLEDTGQVDAMPIVPIGEISLN